MITAIDGVKVDFKVKFISLIFSLLAIITIFAKINLQMSETKHNWTKEEILDIYNKPPLREVL